MTPLLRSLTLLLSLLAMSPCLADEAADEWDKVNQWMQSEAPKKATRSKLKSYRRKVCKRIEAFVEKYPKFPDRPRVELLLGETYLALPDYTKAMKLFEDMAKDKGDRGVIGRVGVLKGLLQRRKISSARKRLDAFLEAHPDEPSLLEFDSFMAKYDKRKRKRSAFKRLKTRQPFPSFAGKLLADGRTWDLSKDRGRVTLLGFWVAYANGKPNKIGRNELERAARLYNGFKGDGLVVLGIPMDTDVDKLREAVKSAGIPFPQLKNGAEVIKDLGVSPLPQWVLLDAKGRILAKNLRGEKLTRAVEAAVTKGR